MNRQRLTDCTYRTIGYIDTAPNGKQTAHNAQFRTVGHYDPHTNKTVDGQYRLVGHGNLLASLLAG